MLLSSLSGALLFHPLKSPFLEFVWLNLVNLRDTHMVFLLLSIIANILRSL